MIRSGEAYVNVHTTQNISFEKYESNDDSACSISGCSKSNDNGICFTRTTGISMGPRPWPRLRRLASADVASAVAAVPTFSAGATAAPGATAGTTKQLTFFL